MYSYILVYSNVTSYLCLMGKKLEINTGNRYNMLTVIKEVKRYVSPSGQPKRKFLFQCDCGNTKEITLDSIRSGATTSCGCYNIKKVKQRRITHGLRQHYLYQTWRDMKKRCYNPKSKDYHNWGGRGIRIYKPWINDFKMFYDWIMENLGERPEGCSLDRYPRNNGNYEPGNLRWATSTEQNNNKRNNIKPPTN